MDGGTFAAVVATGDYSNAVKLLDAAIDDTRDEISIAKHKLEQLYLNRGLCNQKLQLYRKALKVRLYIWVIRQSAKLPTHGCSLCWLSCKLQS